MTRPECINITSGHRLLRRYISTVFHEFRSNLIIPWDRTLSFRQNAITYTLVYICAIWDLFCL